MAMYTHDPDILKIAVSDLRREVRIRLGYVGKSVKNATYEEIAQLAKHVAKSFFMTITEREGDATRLPAIIAQVNYYADRDNAPADGVKAIIYFKDGFKAANCFRILD